MDYTLKIRVEERTKVLLHSMVWHHTGASTIAPAASSPPGTAAGQLLLCTKLTASPLCFDDGLVAGPKEIFLAYGLHQSPALHHLPHVVMDSREHECAILLMQSFMQTMDGFEPGSVNE